MTRILTVLFTFTLAAVALAHEGAPHVKGTLKQVSAQQIVVTDLSGKDVTFAVTKETRFVRAGRPVPWGEAHPGERVVVHGAPGGASAAAVMLGAAPPQR